MAQTASNTTPNDINASLYDTVYSKVKDEKETDAEVDLVVTLANKGDKVLEIGCGTGRHMIKLHRKGFSVTGIDNSQGMLVEARKKIGDEAIRSAIPLIYADILTHDFGGAKYDLIISFWNGINEFALNGEDLSGIFSKLVSVLTDDGKIVLNTEDLTLFDPSKPDFELTFTGGKLIWSLKSYDAITRLSIAEEHVIMNNGRESTAEITQKWWSKEELEKAGSDAGLTMEVKTIPENEELYLVFSKR